MGRFLRHGPCSFCNSRDNRAHYNDGSSFCFGCGKTEGSRYAPGTVAETPLPEFRLPTDLTTEYPLKVLEWTLKYQVFPEDLLKHNVFWSPSHQLLLFLINSHDQTTILSSPYIGYSARTFSYSNKQTRYISRFRKGIESLCLYKKTSVSTDQSTDHTGAPAHTDATTSLRNIVLVEDCLSAIKIARQSDSMALLTSTLAMSKINRLAGLYDTFLVWLDSDMYHNAQKIARRFKLLGKEAHAIYTEKDPKCYSDKEISDFLSIPLDKKVKVW